MSSIDQLNEIADRILLNQSNWTYQNPSEFDQLYDELAIKLSDESYDSDNLNSMESLS